jgi:hypothetical protein
VVLSASRLGRLGDSANPDCVGEGDTHRGSKAQMRFHTDMVRTCDEGGRDGGREGGREGGEGPAWLSVVQRPVYTPHTGMINSPEHFGAVLNTSWHRQGP